MHEIVICACLGYIYIYVCVCVINDANKFNEIDAKIGLIFFKAKRKREKVFSYI